VPLGRPQGTRSLCPTGAGPRPSGPPWAACSSALQRRGKAGDTMDEEEEEKRTVWGCMQRRVGEQRRKGEREGRRGKGERES